MMIRNSFASFSTSRLKMLPDNYSGSKLDNNKPIVKISARHHHHHLCRLCTIGSRRVFLCFVINARTNKHIREGEKLMRKSNESIPHWTSRNRISLSLFIHVTTLSSLCAALKKKERTTKRNFERRDDESTTLSLSSYLTSLCFYILTRGLKILCVVVCCVLTSRRERQKMKTH